MIQVMFKHTQHLRVPKNDTVAVTGEQLGIKLQPGVRPREQTGGSTLWGEPVQPWGLPPAQQPRPSRSPAQQQPRPWTARAWVATSLEPGPWGAQPTPPAPHPPALRGGDGCAGGFNSRRCEQFSGKPVAGRCPGAQLHFAQQPQLRVRPPLPCQCLQPADQRPKNLPKN